jgi:hypothetical protein
LECKAFIGAEYRSGQLQKRDLSSVFQQNNKADLQKSRRRDQTSNSPGYNSWSEIKRSSSRENLRLLKVYDDE